MGTRSTTTVYDTNGKPLVTLYRQMDGYFEGHGEALADFLKDFAIVNGIGSSTPAKAANGMGCLAAQLIAHFKTGIGGFYIVPTGQTEGYNYNVKPAADGRVTLTGNGGGEYKEFDLYGNIDTNSDVIGVVTFVYDKRDSGDDLKWRVVKVTENTPAYIKGYDLNDGRKFKNFLKSKIFGGRVVALSRGPKQ